MRAADIRHRAQDGGGIEQHAARAEHEGFDNQRRRARGAAQRFQRGQCRFAVTCGKRDYADIEQQRVIRGIVHAARADRHRADRIAVIAVLHHDDAGAPGAGVRVKTQRHLERDFDCGRSAVGEEHARKVCWHQVAKALRDGFGWGVSPSGEDHLIKLFGLFADCGDNARVVVAVRRHPPA